MHIGRESSRRHGFTLVEVLTVIGIVVMLMALILPAIQRIREAANKAVCANHLKQIGVAFIHYHLQHGHFPMGGGDILAPGCVPVEEPMERICPLQPMPRVRCYFTPAVGEHGSSSQDGSMPTVYTRRQDWGWAYQILPFLEKDDVWRMSQADDAQVAAMTIAVYFCPSRRAPSTMTHTDPLDPYLHWGRRGCIDYAGNGGAFAINWPVNWPVPKSARPGYAIPVEGWFIKENIPNLLTPAPVYRNGVIVKNRFWPRYPVEPWSRPPIYVDPLVRNADIADGTSNTLLVGEKAPCDFHICAAAVRAPTPVLSVELPPIWSQWPGDCFGWTSGFGGDTVRTASVWKHDSEGRDMDWLYPITAPARDDMGGSTFGSAHLTSMNALFADGSVRSLSYTMSANAKSVRVWIPAVEQTPANPPFMNLTLFQRLCHRFDGSAISDADLE